MMFGVLYKLGKRTGWLIPRFFIIRDNALFAYRDKNQQKPYRIYPLRGLYIQLIRKPVNEAEQFPHCI